MHLRQRKPYLIGIFLSAALVANAACQAQIADSARSEAVDLALPRVPKADEAVWLEIRSGQPARGNVRVSTRDGRLIGVVSLFPAPRSQTGLTYKLPLPPSAIVNGRVQLLLSIEQSGSAPRPAGPGDIDSVTLVYVPVSH